MISVTDDALPELVDAHCHVDLYGKDEAAVIEQIEHQRVHTIAVTNAPSVFFHTRDKARGRTYLHPAVGLHPELVPSHGHELELMWPHLAETRFVGEIGLDYVTSDRELRQRQREVFSQILTRCAERGCHVLTIHSRRSASDVVAAIGDSFPGTVILHWFSGTTRELERAVNAGCWFSVNPAMLRSAGGIQAVQRMPRDRVLTETDGPFAKMAGRACWPQDCSQALVGIARAWGMQPDEVRSAIAANFKRAVEIGSP
jgi:TatD DNase family protein